MTGGNAARGNTVGMQVTYNTVKVIDHAKLLDANSVEHAYTSTRALVPGSYVVVWRADAVPWRYDDSALFFGPFASEDQVKGWLQIFVDVLHSGADKAEDHAPRREQPNLWSAKES